MGGLYVKTRKGIHGNKLTSFNYIFADIFYVFNYRFHLRINFHLHMIMNFIDERERFHILVECSRSFGDALL